jgi:hypothetical protein
MSHAKFQRRQSPEARYTRITANAAAGKTINMDGQDIQDETQMRLSGDKRR